MENEKHCEHSNCTGAHTNRSVCQTLSEMDWERGIWSASLNGELEKVEQIINKAKFPETSVNQCDNSGYSALHYAARNGHIDICRLLLQNRANINAQTNGNATPLHKAAVGRKVQAVKLLIEKGADVQIQDADGQTALHKAAGHEGTTSLLLAACPALAQVKDHRGNLPLIVADK